MFRQFHSISNFVMAAAVIACLTTFAMAQSATKTTEEAVKFPDTPAGKTVAEFFKAFNSGSLETMKKFHQDHGGNIENAEKDKEAYDQTGGLKVHSITRAEKAEVELLVQTKNGGKWLSFVISIAQDAPYAVTDIRAQPTSAPSENGDR